MLLLTLNLMKKSLRDIYFEALTSVEEYQKLETKRRHMVIAHSRES